jgi:hypothetical protein
MFSRLTENKAMNREQNLLKVVYGYISLSIGSIVVGYFILGGLLDTVAVIWLLVACSYIRKYGRLGNK